MKEFIYKHFKLFLILFSVLSWASITKFWWISSLSVAFFIWNFCNANRKSRLCISILSLTFLLLIFNFAVIIPTRKWGENLQAEWDKTGFDYDWINNTQTSLNVIDRAIEHYKSVHGTYPNYLYDIQWLLINNHDYSYRIKGPDGQTNGVPFVYEKLDSNKFYLAGVGKDGIPVTSDDILPQIPKGQVKTTGLAKYVVKSLTLKELKREEGIINMDRKVKELMNKFGEK